MANQSVPEFTFHFTNGTYVCIEPVNAPAKAILAEVKGTSADAPGQLEDLPDNTDVLALLELAEQQDGRFGEEADDEEAMMDTDEFREYLKDCFELGAD